MLLRRSFFRKVFLLYLIFTTVITALFLGIFFHRLYVENERNTQEEYRELSEIMSTAVDRKFDEIKTIGVLIRNTSWYPHVISTGPYFDEYFNSSTKQEIVNELTRYCSIAGIVDSITLFLPQRAEMIGLKYWGDDSTVMKMIGVKDLNDQKIFKKQLMTPPFFEVVGLSSLGISDACRYSTAIIQNLDYTAMQPRASLLILLNNNMLDNYVRQSSPARMVAFSILQDDTLLYSYGDHDTNRKNLTTIHLASKEYSCEYEITLEPKDTLGIHSIILIAIAVTTLFFLIATLCSYLLTRISYRPISKLLRRTETTDFQEEFAGIENSFRNLENKRVELERQMLLYYGAAKSSFLRALLQGCFVEESVEETLQKYNICYQDQQSFRVILCKLSNEANIVSSQSLQVFLALQIYIQKKFKTVEWIELSAAESAFILCDGKENNEEIREIMVNVQTQIREQFERQIAIYCGTEEQGLVGISKSYQNAKEHLANNTGEKNATLVMISSDINMYYYPTDWEIILIKSLKNNDEKTACKIISELRSENIARCLSQGAQIKLNMMVFETIIRVMDELGMDTSTPNCEFEEILTKSADKKQWNYLCSLARMIAQRTAGDSESSDHIGRRMLAYVEKNYSNSAISLIELGNEFNLSSSTVSRVFKSTAKIGFHDYLCRVRMEKAKEIFRNEKTCVYQVAPRVGYENEVSFRRTFLRYEGITPREYILKHSADTDTAEPNL